MEGLERAQRLGCQWVTVNVGPGDTLTATGEVKDLGGLRDFFAKAQSMGLLVTVRLRPDRLGASMIERYPEIEAKGFADIDQAPADAAAGIARLYTLGALSEAATIAFGEGARDFASHAELADTLARELRSGVRVLVKGSRGSAMDRIVKALLASDAAVEKGEADAA